MAAKVEMVPVKSSNVEAIGHRGSTLHVRFKGGGLYTYTDVPAEVFREGVAAESVGGWFRSKVMGKFRHEKHDA